MSFFHRDGGGVWHSFSDEQNGLLEAAFAKDEPAVRLPHVATNPPGHQDFEVRFGSNATSARMPTAPETRMIQVNVLNGNTRVVRRAGPARPAARDAAATTVSGIDRSLNLTRSFSASKALYGWLVKKKLAGFSKGSWQRRFFVLAPSASALYCFAKGLDTREVQLCREGDPSMPKPELTTKLEGAMICADACDPARPLSFSVVAPAAELHVAAHEPDLKRQWLEQLAKVARGEKLM